MASSLTALDLKLVEAVLDMEEGYVLDFSDRGFRAFFQDFDVDIDDAVYAADGRSKARRLRRFLRLSQAELVGRVLEALLEYRLASNANAIPENQLAGFRKLIERIKPERPAAPGEDALTPRTFDPRLFEELPLEAELNAILCARMTEAEKCLQVGAHLSAVILCGSVLEGLCLGFGKHHAEDAKQVYCRRFKTGQAPRLEDWKLAQFINVLSDLGHFSPNIEKFSHSLREFRNFVHPEAELRNGFTPNHHSAHIGFQVVLAAVEDLTMATRKQKSGANG